MSSPSCPSEQNVPPPYPVQQQHMYPPPNQPLQSGYPPPAYPPAQPAGYPPAPYQYPVMNQPQPVGYPYPSPQGQQGTQQTVVINQAVVVSQFGFVPMRTTCPHCHSDITTAVEYEVGNFAWMLCGIITLIGLFFLGITLLGCCFIPFCIPSCKDAVHVCPNCRQTLARVARHF